MTGDVIVRTSQESAKTTETQPIVAKNDPTTIQDSTIDVPFMDYESEHGHPFLVDHFQLGQHWNDLQGGFPKEIETINSYITNKIQSGEIANSQKAVQDMLKGMEKMNNLTKEERTVVKLEVLSHYIEFLQKNDQTRRNLKRYNNIY